MEINYELIIKYLVKKNTTLNSSFITQKSIYNYSTNFPEKFKNLLTEKFYRYGITVYDNENNNISFWSSILTIIDKNFINPSIQSMEAKTYNINSNATLSDLETKPSVLIVPYSSDELELISQFKNQLLEKYSKTKLSSFLKELDKNDLRERFKLEPNIYSIQYLVDILDINILIFDFKTENIYSVYKKNIMNPWKKTVMLAKFNNFWEPIMLIKQKGIIERLFDYNDSTIKKIINIDNLIKYFEGDTIKKHYIIETNINTILQEEKNKLNLNDEKTLEKSINKNIELIEEINETSDTTKDDNIFINNELAELKKLNKTKLKNMKVEELKKIIDKFKIVIANNKPNKTLLIESILAKINS
jgi:hypothetical protein